MSDINIEDALNAESTEEVQVQHKATKNAGRPLKEGEKADKRVVIYLTASQLEEVEEYCYRNRKKVGSFIKETFFNTFNETAEKTQSEIDNFVDSVDSEKLGEAIKSFLKRED